MEWISVNDRLPENGELVVCCRDLVEIIDYFVTNWSNEEEKYYKLNSVTHWMPLPEPPNT